MFFWNSLAFLMIQQMLAIWSLVPLPFLKPAWTSGSSQFMCCWSLAWRILNITLLGCAAAAKSLQSCPTLLWPHPWDSQGKNTRVGCHFLLQCMKVKSEREVTQSCPTLRNPMDCSLPAPPSMGFSRQEYRSGVPLPSPTSVWDECNFVVVWAFFGTAFL